MRVCRVLSIVMPSRPFCSAFLELVDVNHLQPRRVELRRVSRIERAWYGPPYVLVTHGSPLRFRTPTTSCACVVFDLRMVDVNHRSGWPFYSVCRPACLAPSCELQTAAYVCGATWRSWLWAPVHDVVAQIGCRARTDLRIG